MAVPLSKIFRARAMILNGMSVKQVSDSLKIPESTVRMYTKAERERMGMTRGKQIIRR